MSGGDAVLRAIHGRRSVGRVGPEPVARELVEELIEAALAAPNHHLTDPWRFVVLAGRARREVGEAHAAAVMASRPDLPEAARQKEAARLERAPVVIVAAVADHPDPVRAREDRDAVAAGVQNLLLAAHARGLAAMWRTGAMADEPAVATALGLEAGERIVAFVYLGRTDAAPAPRARPRAAVGPTTVWRGW